jgi:hypothetical protein
MKKFAAAALGVTMVLAGILTGTAAQADEQHHPSVEYALQHEPGGVVLDERTVVWPHLGMTLVVDSDTGLGVQSVGPCATGRVCAFGGANLTGAMLSWTTCGTFATGALPSVGSIANARSSGSLQARNGTNVIVTVGANGSANVNGTVTNVRCSL